MATKTRSKAQPKYPCALCGRRDRAEAMVYSSHTGNRYCGSNVNECHARHRRQKRRAT